MLLVTGNSALVRAFPECVYLCDSGSWSALFCLPAIVNEEREMELAIGLHCEEDGRRAMRGRDPYCEKSG
jgi:hypothetical protein